METLFDIMDNGRRIVSLRYTDAELSAIQESIKAKQAELQRQYDIENENTIQEEPEQNNNLSAD